MIVAALMLLVAAGDIASAQVIKVSPEAQTAIDSKSQYQWITFKIDRRYTLQLVHAEPMRLNNVPAQEEYGEYEYAKKEAFNLFSEFLEGLPSDEALLAYFFFPIKKFFIGANPFLLEWFPSRASPIEKYVQNAFTPDFLLEFPSYFPFQPPESIDDGNNFLERNF